MIQVLDAMRDTTEAGTAQYLTFSLDREFYAIAFEKVRRVLLAPALVPVGSMPDYVCGTVDYAGEAVPVVNLRVRFALHTAPPAEPSCVIVVEAALPNGGRGKVGLLVDDVDKVVEIETQQIRKPVDFGVPRRADYIVGMARVQGDLDAILDLDLATAGTPKMVLELSS
jgi:purine-binding chemotaxis protein CheW